MSCLWTCFQSKKPSKSLGPRILSDPKMVNPLHLEPIPNDIPTLQAMEHAIIENLLLIDNRLVEAKKRVADEFRKGASSRAQDALAKRAVLAERKRLYESKLQKIQSQLANLRSTK